MKLDLYKATFTTDDEICSHLLERYKDLLPSALESNQRLLNALNEEKEEYLKREDCLLKEKQEAIIRDGELF